MENKKRLIEIPSDGIVCIPIMCGDATVGEKRIDLRHYPTVEAVEVVHGRWEDFCNRKMCCCSDCKAEFDNTCNDIHVEWNYCPNCGAKMDGDLNGTLD